MENAQKETEIVNLDLLKKSNFNHFKKQVNQDLRQLNSEIDNLKTLALQNVSTYFLKH